MPKPMEREDWIQTVSEVESAGGVWYENVVGDSRDVSFSLPVTGRYRVIFVKLGDAPKMQTPPALHLRGKKISRRVRALRGSARINDERDYKDILADALSDGYETLG